MVYISADGSVGAKKVVAWYAWPAVVVLGLLELVFDFFASCVVHEKRPAGVVKLGGRFRPPPPKPGAGGGGATPNIRGVKDLGLPSCAASGG